ncbi:MAG: hypothetical protein AAF721_02715 [Myxococcota bacterium]
MTETGAGDGGPAGDTPMADGDTSGGSASGGAAATGTDGGAATTVGSDSTSGDGGETSSGSASSTGNGTDSGETGSETAASGSGGSSGTGGASESGGTTGGSGSSDDATTGGGTTGATTDGMTGGTTDAATAGTTDASTGDAATAGTTDAATSGTTDAATDGTTDATTGGGSGSTDGSTAGSTDGSTDGSTGGSTDGSTGDTGGGPGGGWVGDGDPGMCGSDLSGWPGTPATADLCVGVTCDAPPANACLDADSLRAFEPAGTCNAGGCDYRYVDVICDLGCSGDTCVDADCAGTGPCDTPPAPTCFDNQTLRTYWPMGTCNGASCDYAFWDIDCSAGCFGGACLLQSDLRADFWEPSLVGDVELRSRGSGVVERLVAGGGDVALEWPTPAGYVTAQVDTVLGANNTAGFARDSLGQAVVAYQVSNVAPNQLRLAWQDAPNATTFNLEILEFSEGIAPAVVMAPSDDAIVAYLASDPLQLFVGVAPVGGGWSTEAVDLAPDAMLEPNIQMLRDDDGTLHVVVADLDTTGTDQPPALYATGTPGGAWATESIADAQISRRALGRNEAGDPELVYIAVDYRPQNPRNQVRMARLDPAGSTLDAVEGILGTLSSTSANFFHVSGGDGDVQIVSDLGNAYWRVFENRWERRDIPGEGLQAVIDDDQGRPVYLGVSGDYIMPHACVPQCDGLDCGSDGCGGSCGECAAGETCSTAQTCSSMRWEDLDEVEPSVSAIHYDTVDDEFLLVGGGQPATAIRGNTGDWQLETVAQEIFGLTYYGSDSTGDHHVVRFGFSEMVEDNGGGWTQTGPTPVDVQRVKWGPDGLLHAVYTREANNDNETDFFHRTWDGVTWSAEQSLFTQETILSYVAEYQWDWDSNGDMHIVYGYFDWILGGGGFNPSLRHLHNTAGFWQDTGASSINPQSLEFVIGADDEMHVSFRPTGNTTRHWLHRHLSDAFWVNEGSAPWGPAPGRLYKSETGEVYFVAGNQPTFGLAELRQYDGTSDWPGIVAVPDTDPTLAFGCPEPHFFATESGLNVSHRTHWW